jgi:methylmalonyl-CoA mutase
MAPSDPIFTQLPDLDELFGRPSMDDWRKIAEASLKGKPLEKLTVRTHEGIEVPPLASAGDVSADPGYPGQQPFVRGRTAFGPGPEGWEVCQRLGHPDPEVAARWAAEDLERGAGSMWVVFDRITRAADDSTDGGQGDGVRVSNLSDLAPFFDHADLAATPVHLAPGGAFAPLAAILVAAARAHDISPGQLHGSLDADPIGALATDGFLFAGLDGSMALLADLVAWTDRHAPGLRAITVSTLPYNLAGATAVQELAFALATAVDTLRSLSDHGIPPQTACRHVGFRHGMGRDLFMDTAKLRATRRLWARAVDLCGVDEHGRGAPIHAVASPRVLTTRDPWVNILRTTVGAFAASVGGADILTVLPFDAAIGQPDELARRLAANAQTILREESHLGRVIDPGGGSWYLEKLTNELAEAAWAGFQAIEAAGGMAAALLDGSIATELDRSRSERERALATGHDPITGVSSYPNLGESPVDRPVDPVPPDAGSSGEGPAAELARLFTAANEIGGDGSVIEFAIEAATAGATVAQLAAALRATRQPVAADPLPAHRDAEIFERLRDASDLRLEDEGCRPRIFLANMGAIPAHKPRATFAVNFFEAGGIETIGNDGFATADEAAGAFAVSQTEMAVICSSDSLYPEVVPELARALVERGARTVLLAGRPGEYERSWRDAGVTGFIYAGCDQYRMLADLLREEGVLHV